MDSNHQLKIKLNKIIDVFKALNNIDYYVTYKTKYFFIFNEEDDKWCFCNENNFDVPVIFSDIFNNNQFNLFQELDEYFQKNPKTNENIRQLFFSLKSIIHKTIVKIFEIDKHEEEQNLFYLTFEQLVNTARYLEYHMICLKIQSKYFELGVQDLNEYFQSISYLEYLIHPNHGINQKIQRLARKNEIHLHEDDFNFIKSTSQLDAYKKIITCHYQKVSSL